MTIYSPGEVILTEVAFSGARGRKQRPAVVISSNEFNRAGTKLIVAAITGSLPPPFRLGDVVISEWQKAGLVKPSAMRCFVTTVDRKDVVRLMGQMAESDFANVESAIAQVLGFSTS